MPRRSWKRPLASSRPEPDGPGQQGIKTKAFSFIRKVDYKTLMAAVQNEHPQTLAHNLSPHQLGTGIQDHSQPAPEHQEVDVVGT